MNDKQASLFLKRTSEKEIKPRILKLRTPLKTILFAGLLSLAGCADNNEQKTGTPETTQEQVPAVPTTEPTAATTTTVPTTVQATEPTAVTEKAETTIKKGSLKFGKYGCTSSVYTSNGYEYHGRGFITLSESGDYSYEGFKEPSKGKYTVDDKGNLHFKGGYLDAGEASKIDRPDKFFLVFPTIPDNRWTMGLVED